MDTSDIEQIRLSLSLNIPEDVRSFLSEIENLPGRILEEGDVIGDPSKLVALNQRLRTEGYYHLEWKEQFLAVGTDPGDCVYFFDLQKSPVPAVFADHDCDDVEDFEKLADTPSEFREYLFELSKDWDRQDLEIK